MPGVLLTAWTIRLALACYAAYLAGWLVVAIRGNSGTSWPRVARWLWTAGCVLFVIHVACAFHFYHDWSHAAAFEKTAAETEQLLGLRFGEGIYFSYLFLMLWVLEVIAIWTWPGVDGQTPRPLARALRLALHAYLFFIAFNGAIIFEAGPTRWAGIAACLVLGGLAVRAAYTQSAECGLRIAE
ncbi:MAG: hypothetical protein L0211_10245 [Planctomycetaceae bacterium]|nr:hypothetical protein [Planctomycetaceae bacterium]